MINHLFSSRKFWAAVLAIFIIAIQFFIPDFYLNEEQLIGLIMVVASYIIGVAVDGGAGIQGVVSSRKFWAAVLGIITTIATALYNSSISSSMPISQESFIGIMAVISAYIIGVAIEDKKAG